MTCTLKTKNTKNTQDQKFRCLSGIHNNLWVMAILKRYKCAKMWTSHLIVWSHYTDRHPVGVSTDTERVPAAVCHRGYILLIAERIRKVEDERKLSYASKSAHGKAIAVSWFKSRGKNKNIGNQPVAEVVFKVSSDQRHGELVRSIWIKHIKFLWSWRSHFIGAGTWSQRSCRWVKQIKRLGGGEHWFILKLVTLPF